MIKKVIDIIHDARWLVVGNFVYAFSQWILVIILAKFGTTKMLGQYVLSFAIVAPVFIFTNMQLRSLVISDIKNKYDFLDFLSFRFFLSSIGIVICLVLSLFYTKEVVGVIILVAILRFIESIVDVYHAIFNKHNKLYFIGLSLLVKGVLYCFSFFISLYFFNSIYIALSITFIFWTFLFFIFDFRNLNKIIKVKYKFKSYEFKNIFLKALPLGLTVMLISLQINIPRYFLEQYEGLERLGVFGALSYFVIAGGVFVASIGQAITPKILLYMKNGSYSDIKLLINTIIVFIFIFAIFVVFIFYFFGIYILNFLYGPSYSEWNYILILLMVAGFISYMASIVGYAITAVGVIREQVYVFSILLLMSLFFSFLLIPQFGLCGAALVMMIVSVSQLLITYYLLIRRLSNEH